MHSMPNALTHLLTSPTTSRTTADYERMFDDLMRTFGGHRIDEVCAVPEGRKNADYLIDLGDYEVLIELKQVRKYAAGQTVDAYFQKQLDAGQVRHLEPISSGRARVVPESLSGSGWKHFYKTFRGQVPGALSEAARQLRATESLLPASTKRRIKGVILANTGDFNLSTDLLYRLALWKLNREWKFGQFRSIDFAICLSVDFMREGQHPLHARGIVRSTADEELVVATRQIFDRWVRYGADAIGAQVEYREAQVTGGDIILDDDLASPNRGKVQWIPPKSAGESLSQDIKRD